LVQGTNYEPSSILKDSPSFLFQTHLKFAFNVTFGNMANAREWSTYIKIFSALIIIGGVIDIVATFAFFKGGLVLTWGTLVIGILYLSIGARGFAASISHHIRAARQYYGGVVALTIVVVIIGVVNLVINSISTINSVCDTGDMSSLECAAVHQYYIIGGIIGIAISCLCCTSCAFCARAYYRALLEEGGHHHHHDGYQKVQETGYQQQTVVYGQPIVYGQPQTPYVPQVQSVNSYPGQSINSYPVQSPQSPYIPQVQSPQSPYAPQVQPQTPYVPQVQPQPPIQPPPY